MYRFRTGPSRPSHRPVQPGSLRPHHRHSRCRYRRRSRRCPTDRHPHTGRSGCCSRPDFGRWTADSIRSARERTGPNRHRRRRRPTAGSPRRCRRRSRCPCRRRSRECTCNSRSPHPGSLLRTTAHIPWGSAAWSAHSHPGGGCLHPLPPCTCRWAGLRTGTSRPEQLWSRQPTSRSPRCRQRPGTGGR